MRCVARPLGGAVGLAIHRFLFVFTAELCLSLKVKGQSPAAFPWTQSFLLLI